MKANPTPKRTKSTLVEALAAHFPGMPDQPLPKLIKKARKDLMEELQCYGDMPDVTVENALAEDWLHVLMISQAELHEQLRQDCTELGVIRRMRLSLADIIATCQLWDEQLVRDAKG